MCEDSLVYFYAIIVNICITTRWTVIRIFAGSIGRYNISFNIKIIKCIKCMSCVISNSVMNYCYNSKNNHNFCFAPVHFFCQFAVLRLPCDRRILAHADLGQMKLAHCTFSSMIVCENLSMLSNCQMCILIVFWTQWTIFVNI